MAISTPILAGNRKYPIEKDHNRWAINFPYVMDTKVSLADGAGVTVFGPIQFQSQGQTVISRDLNPPIKLTDSQALNCAATSGGAGAYQGACFVYVEGFTADSPLG